VIIDNNKKLIFGIIVCIVLFGVCVGVDSAENITITNTNNTNSSGIMTMNDSSVVNLNETNSVIQPKPTDKQYCEYSTITITAKPSCSCRYPYKWYTTSFVNYCPICHRYDTLTNKHKYQARYEQEITCKNCDSDFCGKCGKNKYSWSNVYLRKSY